MYIHRKTEGLCQFDRWAHLVVKGNFYRAPSALVHLAIVAHFSRANPYLRKGVGLGKQAGKANGMMRGTVGPVAYEGRVAPQLTGDLVDLGRSFLYHTPRFLAKLLERMRVFGQDRCPPMD
jgi:hypothetical protein